MEFYTRIKVIIPNHRDNLYSLEHISWNLNVMKFYTRIRFILPNHRKIWFHQNISEHDGILHENIIHSTESSGESLDSWEHKSKLLNMMDFYTRIKFIIPDHRDDLDSLEHKFETWTWWNSTTTIEFILPNHRDNLDARSILLGEVGCCITWQEYLSL
jgi:hypothetical protein